MSVKRKRSNTAWSIPGGVAAGLGLSMAIAILCSMLLAWLIIGEKLDVASIGYGSGLILILSAAAGAWLAMWKVRTKRLIVTGIYAAGFILLLLAVTALFFGGEYQGIGVSAICILLGAGGTLAVKMMPKKAGNKRPKIRAYR